ncbi:MAG: ABC transporter ATP-binding protein [Candidatus Omnitrophica bacterium]|nr:ABC transporter ATP-binding protein [Candidatus Omnitrophota bacterium]
MKELLSKLRNILTASEKRRLVLLGVGAMLLSLLETFSIAIVLPLMTLFIFPQKISSTPVLNWLYHVCGSPDTFLFVAILIAVTCVILLARSAYSVFMLYQKQKVLGNIYSRLTSKVLSSYLEKPYSYHLVYNSSELFKNTSSEANNCVNYLLSPAISIASEVIILAGVCLFLIYTYPVLTIAIFVIFGLLSLLVNVFFRKRIKAYAAQRETFSVMLYKNALESLGAVKEIKIYNVHDYFASGYFTSTKSYTSALVKFITVSSLPKQILETVFVILALLGVFFVIYSHKPFIEFIPMMSVFAVAMMRLSASFSKIYESVASFHFGGNSLNIVYDVLKEENDYDRHQGVLTINVSSQVKNISLREVTFCYQTAAHPIFEGLTIFFPLHRICAIVGETGSGKSTVIDLLTGLLTPLKGRLDYCDMPISQDNMVQYQGKIGYVPQHIFLLDGSIISNVAFGVLEQEIDRARVEYAIRVAQLEVFIKTLPEGLDTKVGERGVRISGGQRQRIGIARALYRNPEILILDEASSALDGHTEAQLYAALKNLKDRMTIILVTHRLATLEHADLIYVLEHGKIADQGNYNELFLRSPVFQNIASKKVLSQEGVE